MENKARIAFISFRLESNFHAPIVDRSDFIPDGYFAGAEFERLFTEGGIKVKKEFIGFTETMDTLRAWERIPIVTAGTGPGGCIDQIFFIELKADIITRLKAAMPLDAVFIAEHGAATATLDSDPDGTLFSEVREIVGSETPIVATLDLHANVGPKMIGAVNMLCSFLTNPHMDMYERGQESARAIDEMLKGQKTAKAFVKLPLMPPSTSLNTKFGPYGDLINFGQQQMNDHVMNISICSGFSVGDTPKAGMSISVTTRNNLDLAREVAARIAKRAWNDRHRYTIDLISIEGAITLMLEHSADPSLPALLFADPADNPGGGGRGNTTYILKAMLDAGVKDALLGCMFDPPLAKEAHRLGVGTEFTCTFNSQEKTRFSEPLTCRAVVENLQDGSFMGRHGIMKEVQIDLGPCALLRIDGVQVVVITKRMQCLEPMMIERFGVDLRTLRSLIVKSRGHFRAGFDDIFANGQIVEIDAPGLTTPVLSRVLFENIPRPIYPLDPDMEWEVAVQTEFT
jgi:microcystin degradation protein MlrC